MTTKLKLKQMFLSGEVLTSCGTAQQFVTSDLRRYVTDFKREGLDIIGEWVYGESGKKFKKYYIKKKQLTLAI